MRSNVHTRFTKNLTTSSMQLAVDSHTAFKTDAHAAERAARFTTHGAAASATRERDRNRNR
jgi:hypothetical protein